MKNYSKKFNTFFIHIPKNAGTSIQEALEIDTKLRGHRPATKLKEMYKEYEQCNSIVVIRNPWDRLVSLYEFRKKRKQIPSNHTFEKWIKMRLSKCRQDMNWKNQIECIHDGENLLVTHLLRFENLKNEWQKLSEEVYGGTLPNLNKLNSTIQKKYRNYYNEQTRELVQQAFAKDINYFGYEF